MVFSFLTKHIIQSFMSSIFHVVVAGSALPHLFHPTVSTPSLIGFPFPGSVWRVHPPSQVQVKHVKTYLLQKSFVYVNTLKIKGFFFIFQFQSDQLTKLCFSFDCVSKGPVTMYKEREGISCVHRDTESQRVNVSTVGSSSTPGTFT